MKQETNKQNSLLTSIEEQANNYRQRLVDSSELVQASRLALSSSDIEELQNAGRLFDIQHDGVAFYPAFFNDPSLDKKELGDMCQILQPLSGSAKWQFFTRPKNSLAGKTPLDALRDGEVSKVERAALGFLMR